MLSMTDVTLLRDVAARWQELSENPGATDCMTDSCHVEFDELERIAKEIEDMVLNEKAVHTEAEKVRDIEKARVLQNDAISCLSLIQYRRIKKET